MKGPRLKVTDEQVGIIRRMAGEGVRVAAIARATGLTRPTVYTYLGQQNFAGAAGASRQDHLQRGSMKRKQLELFVDRLPVDIAYLRDAILTISEQDQDLLGSGEADTSPITDALRRAARGSPLDPLEVADVLRRWLEEQPEHESPWASPAWFVEGFLRGCDLFGAEHERPTSPSRHALGLQRIELDVPVGMKSKLYAGGLELRNREVKIMVIELEDWAFQAAWDQVANPFPPELPRPPHLRDERDSDFKIGQATGGVRLTSRHVESGLPIMVSYVLMLPTANISVSMFSPKKNGSDLSKYEGLLAMIRCK